MSQRWVAFLLSLSLILSTLIGLGQGAAARPLPPEDRPSVQSAPQADPTQVTLVGNLQSHLGVGCGNWDPSCTGSNLTYQGYGVWRGVFTVQTETPTVWEYKIALNGTWDESYKGNHHNGWNTLLPLDTTQTVRFYFDYKTKAVLDNVVDKIAVAAGTFQDALGCPGEWQPACVNTLLTDPDGDGIYEFRSKDIPAGSYEFKVALNEAWDESYPGSNVAFNVPNDGDTVIITWNATTKQVKVKVETPKVVDYVIFHYYRPADDYEGWGLHLWGSADEEVTWSNPKPFAGFDDFGAYVAVKVKDPTQPLGFIVHKGDEKDTPADRYILPEAAPEVWIVQGDATNYTSRAQAQKFVTVHYKRGDYDGWGLHLWQPGLWGTDWSAPLLPGGFDDYGAVFTITQQAFPNIDFTQPIYFIVHKGDEKDTEADRQFDPLLTPTIWLKQGDPAVYGQRGAAEGYVLLHYRRVAQDYGDYTSNDYRDFWGVHAWNGVPDPGWTTPYKAIGQDDYGVIFKLPLNPGATEFGYIVHRGDEKDPGPDQFIDVTEQGYEIWLAQHLSIGGVQEKFTHPAIPLAKLSRLQSGDLSRQKAYWVTRDTIAWAMATDISATYHLCASQDATLTLEKTGITGGTCVTLTPDPAGLPESVKAKFPHLAALPALKLAEADVANVPAMLKGQVAVDMVKDGSLTDATGLQIPGVLDDLYTYTGPLGVIYEAPTTPTSPRQSEATTITLKLWAPTAQDVTLLLYANPITTTVTAYPMVFDPATGVWSYSAPKEELHHQYYLYQVTVFAPSTQKIEVNRVTDPYAIGLSMNSQRSFIFDLAHEFKPEGWDTLVKPPLTRPEDIVIYELHMRDFSANDPNVSEAWRGKYKAFTVSDSYGMQHLRALAEAGLTHIHLLPSFDIATINEDETQRQEPDWEDLANATPDSDYQQSVIAAVRDQDAYNWGYDPLHYNVPEGSYATNPDGGTRTLEFREMVQALNQAGLRVVMDVVYNHTNASGQSEKSVLDRIVPGYYHRLNANGQVENSTCCSNTASEHAMMEKLLIDSVLMWARYYKVDGFRFDIMGHHLKSNLLKLRAALDELTLEQDGVDGKSIYLYGEGWSFGEMANNARGENAAQLNMAGTGIGTFNDRLRDAVRGGGPFDSGETLIRTQGFINGLYYDPNTLNSGSEEEKQKLLYYSDLIRIGLAGNLAEYTFVDRNDQEIHGHEIDYFGQPAGYTGDPQENIVYISAHDNQTLYDNNAYKLPVETTMEQRVRAQNMGISLVALAQGVPFFHAGVDMLRSKSFDRDSYNSGDWFNKLDFTYHSNNFGVGLPPADKNAENWDIIRPLLANPALKPGHEDILKSVMHMREMLRIRKSSPLFRLETGLQVQQHLRFYNTGSAQIPGLIVMELADENGEVVKAGYRRIVVLFNATDEAITFTAEELAGRDLVLHPIQAHGYDPVVKTASYNSATGSFTIPARTTAVFIERITTFFPIIYHNAMAVTP